MVKPPTFEIIAGSYEEFLLGYNFSYKDSTLTQSFAAHDHTGSIRCVALSGHYVASGGADDRIFVYDFKTRKEHCSLTHHNATVNCLTFTENHSHLISGSSDGVLTITRVGNWQLEKVWDKAHKGAAILDIAVHSSGKLALTLGADGTLCTWNLVKGRQAYIINLRGKSHDLRSLERIIWNPDGVKFILYGGKYTEIWSIESGGVLNPIEHKEKVTSCIWKDENTIIVGHENGDIVVINTEDDSRTEFKAHESRVKALTLQKKYLVSVSSSGEIKVWNKHFEEAAAVDTGCRLTCVCVVPTLKMKKEDVAEEETAILQNNEAEDSTKKSISQSRVIEVTENSEDEVEFVNKAHKKKKRQQNNLVGEIKEKKKKKPKI